MSASENAPALLATVPVTVYVDPARIELYADDERRAAFIARLSRHADALARDLGLPANVAIGLETVNDSLRDDPPLRIDVAGVPCRIDRTLDIPRMITAHYLADRAAEALYWNRARLLSRELIGRVHESYCSSRGRHAGKMPADQLGAFLQHVIAQGLSVRIGLEVLDRWAEAAARECVPDYTLASLLADRFPDVVTAELGPGQYAAVCANAPGGPEKLSDAVTGMVGGMRRRLFDELGVKFPELRVELSETLDDHQYRVRVGSVAGPVRAGMVGDAVLLIDPIEQLLDTVSGDLRRQAALFMTMAQVEHALGHLNQPFPMAVFNLLERYSLVEVQHVLQRLLEEGVSVRDLRAVIEALLESSGAIEVDDVDNALVTAGDTRFAPSTASGDDCGAARRVALVRTALCWQLTHQHGGRAREIPVIEVTPDTERRILQTARRPLEQAEKARIWDRIAHELRATPGQAPQPPILTSASVRRRFYELVQLEFPHLAVIAREELAAGTRATRIGLIDALSPLPD